MSIASEISRLQTAKSDLKTSINAKGGTLTTETLDDYAAAVDALSTGGVTFQSKTVTPNAAGQTVTPDVGYDALSSVIINGDADLVAGNVKKDTVIFGVTGTYEVEPSPFDPYETLTPMENLEISYSYTIT